MVDFTAACFPSPLATASVRGRARSSRSRTQGEAFGGAKGEPEDADPAQISRVIRARGVVESAISGGAFARGGRLPRSRLSLRRARLRGALRRQALLDRVEPAGEGAQLVLQLAELLVGGRPGGVDRGPYALAHLLRPRLRTLDQVVDGLLRPDARLLCGADRRGDRALDGVAHRIRDPLRGGPALGHASRSVP